MQQIYFTRAGRWLRPKVVVVGLYFLFIRNIFGPCFGRNIWFVFLYLRTEFVERSTEEMFGDLWDPLSVGVRLGSEFYDIGRADYS